MINKLAVVYILLVIFSLSSCSFNSQDKIVDAEKSKYYFYTSSKKDVIYKYKKSFTGLKYWWIRTQLNADVESFIVLSRSYAKDKNNGYYKDNKFSADTKSLEYIKGEYCKDKNHVFFKGIKVTNADVATFITDKESTRDKFHIFKDFFSSENDGKLTIVDGANPASYRKLSNNWAKDDSSYFFFNEKINVDFHTFRLLTDNIGIDKNTIYYFAGKPSYGYGKSYQYTGKIRNMAKNIYYDNNSIYNFRKTPVSVISIKNPKSIQIIDTTQNIVFFADNSLYWNMKERNASHIDIETFKTKENYATDKYRVYYRGIEIKGADVHTFSIVHSHFSKDKNYVYHREHIFPEADPDTFTYIKVKNGQNYYRDKNYKWKYDFRQKIWEKFS